MQKKVLKITKVSNALRVRQYCTSCADIRWHIVTKVPGKLDVYHCSFCGIQKTFSLDVP